MAAALAAPVSAQNAGTATAAESGAEENANEIIVTARRSNERLQDVPIAVSALSAEDLKRQSVDDLSDIAEKTVGFAFEPFTGLLAQPTIRGQTNLRTTSPVQNVATYLNGIYLQRNYFIDQSLLELSGVEIIKGPQSALYGRNSFAGVINLTARSANAEDFAAGMTGTYGSDERMDVRGSFNVPIIPGTLGVFVAAGHSQFDGTWKNNHPLANAGGATDGNVGGWNKEAYQVGAVLNVGESITADINYFRTERDQEHVAGYTLSTAGLTYNFNSVNASPTGVGAARQNRLWVGLLPATPPANSAGETRLPGLVIDPRAYGLRGPTDVVVGKLRYDNGGPLSVEYTYGYTKAEVIARGSSARDPLTPTVVFGTNFGVVFDASGTDSAFTSDSHDLKMRFKFSDKISGFVGSNFQKTNDIESNASEFAPVNSLQEPNPASRFAVFPGAPIPTAVTFRRTTFLQREEKVFSTYGYLDIRPNDRVAIALEGRYTTEDQDAADLIAPNLPPNQATVANVTPTATRTAKFFTPRASVTYKFSDDNNVYASVARGYKSGGFNGVAALFNATFTTQLTPGTAFALSQQTYAPETNWTYEIGSKNSLLDGRATLNVAAYYTDWKNLQSNAVRLNPNGLPPASFAAIVPSVIGNIGDVRVYGIEVEGTFRVAEPLRLNYGLSYNNARYKSGTYSQRFGASGNCDGTVCSYTTVPAFPYPVLDISGNQLERTPEFDALLGATYERELANGWDYFLRGDVTYQTKQFADEGNLAFVPSRAIVNASTGINAGKVNL
ncbi:MAG: TonB-dependent receptor, partial [Alphaproteobacteria bacterium]|nr:TonB-dependent receptor [Alphaproteobacteria bacterium]